MGHMLTAKADCASVLPSTETRAPALVESPLVAPEFLKEHDFEQVRVDDSPSLDGASAELHNCCANFCDELDRPTLTIIMATYQGERFLNEQLDSIAAQTHRNWRLCVSDDGSTDETRAIVQEFGAALTGRNDVDLLD